MEGFSDVEASEKLVNALKSLGNDDAISHIYEGAGHSFMDIHPDPFETFAEREQKMGYVFGPYNPAHTMLAWPRLMSFLSTHLEADKVKEEL